MALLYKTTKKMRFL